MDSSHTPPSSEPMQEFRASWRSTAGFLTVVMALLTVFTGFSLARSAKAGVPMILLASAAICGAVTWLLGHRLLSRRPALQLSPSGIRSFANRGELIAWRHIVDVRQVAVQYRVQLLLTLAPDSGVKTFFGRRCNEFGIPLVFFRSKVRKDVAEATLDAYARYGGEQFVQAHAAPNAELLEASAFEARLTAPAPVTWGLYAVVALNIGVWALMVGSGVGAMKPGTPALLAWGANSAASVVEDREYWRLLTATFLHNGWMHLTFNIVYLWRAGKQLSRRYGNAQFLLIYVASALAGSALSLHFSAQQSVAVGASGAVFGVLAARLVAGFRHRGELPQATGKNLLVKQGIFLICSLGLGLASPTIDNAAHAGGLVAGVLLALLLVDRLGGCDEDVVTFEPGAMAGHRKNVWMPVWAGAVLAGAAVWALVTTTPLPTVHHRQLFALQAALQAQLPAIARNRAALQVDTKAYRVGTLTQAQFIDTLETRHLPAFAAVDSALAPFDLPVSDRLGLSLGLRDLRQANALRVELIRLQVQMVRQPEGRAAADLRIHAINAELRFINAEVAELAKKPG